MHARMTAALAATVMALAISGGPAIAADHDASVPESFTVLPTISISLETASVDYGALAPGATSLVTHVNGNVVSNAPIAIDFAGSPFAGPAQLNQDTRLIHVWNVAEWPDMTTVLDPDIPPLGFHTTSVIEAAAHVYTADGPCGPNWCPFGFALKITPPADALAGAYSGAIELSFSTTD